MCGQGFRSAISNYIAGFFYRLWFRIGITELCRQYNVGAACLVNYHHSIDSGFEPQPESYSSSYAATDPYADAGSNAATDPYADAGSNANTDPYANTGSHANTDSHTSWPGRGGTRREPRLFQRDRKQRDALPERFGAAIRTCDSVLR